MFIRHIFMSWAQNLDYNHQSIFSPLLSPNLQNVSQHLDIHRESKWFQIAQLGKWAMSRPDSLMHAWQLLIRMRWVVLFLFLPRNVPPILTTKGTGPRGPASATDPLESCRHWWNGGILTTMRTWDKEEKTQRSALPYSLKPSVFCSSSRFLKISFALCSQQLGCKAWDLPWRMSSTMASEGAVPPACSDAILPLLGARPAARLSANLVICTQCFRWTWKMVHLVSGRMSVEFITQTRRLGKKGLLITPGQPTRVEPDRRMDTWPC